MFIKDAGGCLCTKSVLEGKTPLKWCFRDNSVDVNDNGWRFLGRDDDEEYINTVSNNIVVDFNTVVNLEPAILGIYTLPVGTDLYIERGKDKKIHFYTTGTRDEFIVVL